MKGLRGARGIGWWQRSPWTLVWVVSVEPPWVGDKTGSREAGLGSLSLYFPICGMGMVTFTRPGACFHKLKAEGCPTLFGVKSTISLSAGKAMAQK